MGNFVSNLWEDITGQTAAEKSSEQIQAGTEQAAEIQREGLALMQEQFDWTKEQAEALQAQAAPFQEAALSALGQYQQILQDPNALAQDPTLQFLQQQGQQQVESSAAARGTQLSGRTLAELGRTGQSVAATYRGQILGELGGLMGMGTSMSQQATSIGMGATGAAAGQVGQVYGSLADLQQQQGAAQAAATMGAYQGTAGIVGGGLTGLVLARCSRTFKENYTPVDPDVLLDQLEQLDIEEWNYIGDNQVHVSPYAEDFKEITGKGDGKTIAYIDMIGLLMGSVKALSAKVKELEGK